MPKCLCSCDVIELVVLSDWVVKSKYVIFKSLPYCYHFLVLLELITNVQPPRGPRLWKFNLSLLEDRDYTEKMTRKIPQFIENCEYLDDKGGLLWEMVKWK